MYYKLPCASTASWSGKEYSIIVRCVTNYMILEAEMFKIQCGCMQKLWYM